MELTVTTPARTLVTGGSGFIGTNLVADLLADGAPVLNIDIAPPKIPDHREHWQKVDILDRDSLAESVADWRPERVIHLAARTDLDERRGIRGYAANIEGVANVIAAIAGARTVRRSIFASSRLVFDIDHRPASERDYHASTSYGRSKAQGEELVRSAGDQLASWVIVRPTSIWGPWFGAPYRQFFSAIERGLYVHPGSRRVQKSYGYVDNAVHQIRRLSEAAEADVNGRTFWLADEPLIVHEWAESIRASLGARSIPTLPVPLLAIAGVTGDIAQRIGIANPPLTSFRVRNMTTDMFYDTAETVAITGSSPVSMMDGVQRTVAWIQERRAHDR